MKIDITPIIIAHWRTLYNAQTRRVAYDDIAVFYVLPIFAAAGAYWFGLQLKPDHYSASITFFGIFLALLLNIQVAIFSIFQRKWEIPSDRIQAHLQSEEIADRRSLLSELNTNIAYLTVFSCVALVLFLIFYILDKNSNIESGIATFLYFHFLLTFVMVVKRAHALFQKEYRDRPN